MEEVKELTYQSENPLVSIIVVTYNSAKYVRETLESAKAQTYQNIELIITDDASQDDTVEKCRTWIVQNKERFTRTEVVTVKKNSGIPENCNRGIINAKGKWVKIIAGDDVLLDSFISQCVDFLEKPEHENIKFLWTNIQRYKDTFIEENASPVAKLTHLKINQEAISPREQFEILLRYNPILAVSFIANKEVFKEVAYFTNINRLFEDWPTWLSITKEGHKIHYLDIVGVKYREHSGSVQKKSSKKMQLISDFNLLKSQMILEHYLKYYPKRERILVFYLNSVNLIFNKIKLNGKNKFNWFLYHLFTYLPRLIWYKIIFKYK